MLSGWLWYRKYEGRESVSPGVSPASGNVDVVESLQLPAAVSVQRNCTTQRPKTVGVQFQLGGSGGGSSKRHTVPPDFAAGDASTGEDDAWKGTDEVDLQLPPSPSYYDIVLAADDQRVGAAGRPLLSRHRRLDENEDVELLQCLLPSSATDDDHLLVSFATGIRRCITGSLVTSGVSENCW